MTDRVARLRAALDETEIERRALDGLLVLDVAEAEQLYGKYGTPAAFEALANAFCAAKPQRESLE